MDRKKKLYIVASSFLIILFIAVFVLIKNANLIVKSKLEEALKGFSVERIELNWGSVEAFNIAFKKPDGTLVFKTDSLYLSLDFTGLIKKEYNLSSLVFKNPYLLIETDKDGQYINPFSDEKGKASTPMPQVSIKRIAIHGGSVTYSDRKVTRPPLLTKLENMEFEINDITIPFIDTLSSFILETDIPARDSKGAVKSSGKINLKTRDLNCKVSLKNLDITQFKPYFQKKGDANISKGLLDLELKADVKEGMINAPGRATIKGLAFRSEGGLKDSFLGVPRDEVLHLLKNSNGAIVVDFVLTGNLKNPRFSLRETFAERMTIGLAEKLGLPVSRIGETVVVGGAKQVEKGFKGIGGGLKKIFR